MMTRCLCPLSSDAHAYVTITHESGARYSNGGIKCLGLCSWVDVYARTLDTTGKEEVAPQWSDCRFAINMLKQACGDVITDWQCELQWGNCEKCGWGSCIKASFRAPSACAQSVSVSGGGAEGGPTASVGFGLTPIGNVVTNLFGKPTCDLR